jgi:hypothetical protein
MAVVRNCQRVSGIDGPPRAFAQVYLRQATTAFSSRTAARWIGTLEL